MKFSQLSTKKRVKDKVLFSIPSQPFTRLKFFLKVGYVPRIRRWRSFNEYLNYIKLYDRNQMRVLFADRLAVREYVKLKAPELEQTKILWVGSDFTRDVWDSLPNKFVVKAAHGSGMVEIVDKATFKSTIGASPHEELNKEFQAWLKYDIARCTREWYYDKLPRLLICEEYIESGCDDIAPPDYKFFVINGRVEMVQVDSSRFFNHARALYNSNFEEIGAALIYKRSESHKKPACFDEAITAAEKLAAGFLFLRIDLYLMDKKIYFGEITNTPEAGFGKFSPRQLDFDLGRKIKAI